MIGYGARIVLISRKAAPCYVSNRPLQLVNLRLAWGELRGGGDAGGGFRENIGGKAREAHTCLHGRPMVLT